MTTRVGVNLLWLVPGQVGGSEEYWTRLLAAVGEAPAAAELDLRLYVHPAFPEVHPALAERFETVVGGAGGSRARRVAAEATWLARRVKDDGLAIVHHGGGTIPVRAGPRHVRQVLTVHDLQPLTFPEHFSRTKRTYLGRMLPRSVREADLVVTLTDFVADDVHERLGVPTEKLARVPPGIQAPPSASAADRQAVADRYRLGDRPFFLYPAITFPHKNHLFLVHAFAVVRARHPEALLVLTGGEGEREQLVRDAIHRLGLHDHVRRPGRIPAADLEVLYQSAAALALPSRYEGTGIPALEAMAAGCPVVASDSTGLPEVVADAGLLLGSRDINTWVEVLNEVLEQPALRTRLAEAGRARARSFSWTRSADALAGAYRRVLVE